MNLPLCSHTDKHTHTLECENVCVLCAFPTFETNNFKSICAQMLIAHTEEVFFFENEENAGYFIQINFIFFKISPHCDTVPFYLGRSETENELYVSMLKSEFSLMMICFQCIVSFFLVVFCFLFG